VHITTYGAILTTEKVTSSSDVSYYRQGAMLGSQFLGDLNQFSAKDGFLPIFGEK
jgi:hypothetical protein